MCFDVLDEGCVGGGEKDTRKGWTGGKENERRKRNAEDTRKRKKKKALGSHPNAFFLLGRRNGEAACTVGRKGWWEAEEERGNEGKEGRDA